jgi:hypothetical protein
MYGTFFPWAERNFRDLAKNKMYSICKDVTLHMASDKVASGGTVKRIGLSSRLVHTFTESGDFIVHRPTLIRYLIVGGRGGGPAPDAQSKIDQEGGIGEVVEGTSTYRLQPGTYKVTVGPRSTTFTEKGIAGTGRVSPASYSYGWSGSAYGPAYLVYEWANRPVVWNGRTQRVFKQGNPSSIAGVASAKGGVPHPGISNQPGQRCKGPTYGWNWGYATPGGGTCSPYYNSRNRDKCVTPIGTTVCNMDVNDRTWKDSIENGQEGKGAAQAKANEAAQKESDITGAKEKYGLKPMVVISYDESQAGPVPVTTPPPTTAPPVDLDKIAKEYEQKMAELRAAAEAEKQALQAQNAAAAGQARQIQQQLLGELAGLKAQYDQLKASAASASKELESTKQEMVQIKTEYDQKMLDLAAAQKKELEAIASQNAAAIEAARLEKEKLVAELKELKVKFDTAVALSKQCPIIPENTVLVDGKTGQMYRYEAGMLRAISLETYRALGSPKYTTYKAGSLDNCPRGPDIQVPTVTPKPTEAPLEDPAFPSTVYVLIHAESWAMKSELRVLASRFGGAVIEPFEFKELAQVFAINSQGYVRSLEGQGAYLTNQDDCLAPIMSKDVPKTGWRLQKTGDSQYGYKLVSSCGVSLKAGVTDRSPVLEKSVFGGDASDEWYVLPIGKMEA